MAGFDLEFSVHAVEEPLVRSLIRAAQRRARRVDVELKYRLERLSTYWVGVDGSMFDIEPLLWRCARELPAVAEGWHNGELKLRRRIRLAERLVLAIGSAMDEFLETQREIASFLGGVPAAVSVDVGDRTHLKGRMQLLWASMSMYLSGQVDAETMIEEAHTAIETLLREAANHRSNLSFAQLVDNAVAVGLIDSHLRERMLTLKDLRKRVKHRGQGLPRPLMDDLVHPVLAVRQRVASSFRGATPGLWAGAAVH